MNNSVSISMASQTFYTSYKNWSRRDVLLPIFILEEVIDLEIKEVPIDERYDRLLDDYLLDAATDYAVLKELGGVDKQLDLSVKMQKKMLPKILGSPVFKRLKILTPSSTFKQFSTTWLYNA